MQVCYHCKFEVNYAPFHTIYTEPEGYVAICADCLEKHKAKMEYDNASHLRDISDGVQRIVNFLETYDR